ncbi:MAG: KGGVGR-motif variant AAA ATPase, partial [Vicinamibacterales bacterium]
MTRPAVVTFYSYKGGVGRTLLAANVAVGLASRGKTLLWDLDVEAPGIHRVRALRSEGPVSRGFFDWLIEWQADREQGVSETGLQAFTADIRRTPFTDLNLLPAHGDEADAARLYYEIDWRFLLADDPKHGRDLFEALLSHLHAEGFRHVVLDSRTGLTDLGALIAGIIPDATVLVGGYSAQNLGGLAQAWRALKRDDAALKDLRAGRTPPELLLVASPISQADPSVVAAGRELWAQTFGLELAGVHEIPFDPDLPFSEAILIGHAEREVSKAYRRLTAAIEELLDRRDESERAAVEERRARPDVFTKRDRLAGDEPAATFEDRVVELLRLHGYTVERQQAIDGEPVDLVVRIQSGVDVTTYLIECKERAQAVTRSTVETVAAWLELPFARAAGARGMIVAAAYAPSAVAHAKECGIRLITPEALERQLVDFGPYLAEQIAAFERSTLATAYVTQRARVDERGGRAASAGAGAEQEERQIDDLVAHGVDWANGRGSRLWVLLGDYGTGKTTFTQKLAYELAKRAQDQQDAPVPLLVNLREVPNKASLDDILHDHWQRASGQRKDPHLFLYLIERGLAVLILDSFDEMGIAAAGRSVVEQLRSLVRVTATPGDTSRANRVLVTCREQFFREHGEAVKAAIGSEPMSELQRVTLSFDGAIDTLERFTEAQVREYLIKRLGSDEGKRAAAFLREHYLNTLADRPQLLDLIIKSLPRLRQVEASGGRMVTTGALYEAYTDEWLEDFKPRERQSGSAQLRAILELLAGVLWGRAGNRIHYGDLYTLFKDRVDLRGVLDPQQLDIELRTAAFLSRTRDGHYGFSHRSFLEYFLARRIEHAATDDEAASVEALAHALDTARLSAEVCAFVDDLAPRDDPRREQLRRALRLLLGPEPPVSSSRAARANALWLAYRLEREAAAATPGGMRPLSDDERYVPDGARLEGIDVSELTLDGIQLTRADMRDVTAVGASFARARLDGSNLAGAVLRRASLVGASLNDTRFDGADCSDVAASGVSCKGMHAARSSWINARLDNAVLDRADFEGADLRGSCLAGAKGRPSKGQSVLDGANVAGVTARGAEGMPIEVGEPPLDRLVPVLRALEGHWDWVRSIAWSFDGARLATGSDDRTVRVWDAASGRLVQTLEGHRSWVRSVAWSPDGARLATGSDDRTVRVWDAASGTLLRTLEGHRHGVDSVAWSPEGARLASGSGDKTVRVWEAASGTLVRTLEGHRDAVHGVTWSPDGARLASGGGDGTVQVWEAASGTLVRTLEDHRGQVRGVAWSPDGARLASGSDDKTVRVWEAASGTLVRTLEGHRGQVRGVAWSPDGARLASGSDDDTVRVWEAATGTLVRTLEGHRWSVNSVAWSPDGARLASGSADDTVRVWEAASGT